LHSVHRRAEMSSSTFQGETSIIWYTLQDRKMGSGQEMELYSVAYAALGEECEPNTYNGRGNWRRDTVASNGTRSIAKSNRSLFRFATCRAQDIQSLFSHGASGPFKSRTSSMSVHMPPSADCRFQTRQVPSSSKRLLVKHAKYLCLMLSMLCQRVLSACATQARAEVLA